MMPRKPIYAGQLFGRLTAVRTVATAKDGKIVWECHCSCGRTAEATSSALWLGKKKSCGCLKPERSAELHRIHGHSKTRTYISWQNMRTRCLNPAYKQYHDYGGRGVTICPQWEDFACFLSDMGFRPEGKSLDRIDPFGNYEPTNCRWATRREQNLNTRGHAAIAKLKQGE